MPLALVSAYMHYFHIVSELSGPALSIFELVIGRILYSRLQDACCMYKAVKWIATVARYTQILIDLYGLLRLFVFQSCI